MSGVELAHQRLQLRVLVGQRGGLEHRALEVHAQLGELAQAFALELDAAAEGVVGVLHVAGLAQRGGDRAQDEAAGVRDLVAEALERALACVPCVVETVQRGERLDLGADGHAEDVRVGLTVLDQRGQGLLGVRQGLDGAGGEQPDVGAGRVQDADQEAVAFQRGGELETAREFVLRLGHAALLVMPAGDVVA